MRLLLIASHKLLAHALERGLREEGFTIEIVHDHREGRQRASEPDIDIILFDLLPKEDVCLVNQLLKKNKKKPMLVLTVPGRGILASLTCQDSRCETIRKPFSFEELLNRLYAIAKPGQ